MSIFIHSFKTSLGVFRCAETKKGLALLMLPGETKTAFMSRLYELFPHERIEKGGMVNKQVEKQVQAYLKGKLKKFTLPLDIQAPPFYKKALRQVMQIPYGQTQTYGDIARAMGNPRAYRAVGSANANNNIPLIIPCHRVVAANGLGGYGGGLDMKVKLLKLEQVL